MNTEKLQEMAELRNPVLQKIRREAAKRQKPLSPKGPLDGIEEDEVDRLLNGLTDDKKPN